MTNKKVVLVIILFIIFGLFIYSFANPLDEEGTDYSGKDNNSISENNNYGNNNSLNQTTDEDDDEKSDDNLDTDEETNEDDTTQVVQIPSNNTSNGGSTSSTGSQGNASSRPNGGGSSKPSGGSSSGNTPSGGNSSGGNQGGNQGGNGTVTPPPVITKQSGATISHIKYATEESDIGVLKTGNTIEFGGRMAEQTPYEGNTDYIKLRIMSIDTFSAEELKNASITVQNKSGIIDLSDGLRIDTSTNHAYVDCEYVFQKINDGNVDENGNPINFSTFKINVNWGYGKEEVYTVILKIEVV